MIIFYQRIIWSVWELPLSPDERVQFMTASKLVSKTWHALFSQISATDLHIPCESYYIRYFHGQYRDFSECNRITFTVYDPKNERPTTRDLAFVRRSDMEQLISLHTIKLVYHDTTYPDPYTQGFVIALPDFIPKLSISYTFSPDVPTYLIEYYRKHFQRDWKTRLVNRQIGFLEVNGANKYIAAVWESLFPSRVRMLVDGKDTRRRKPLMKIENRVDVQMGSLHQLLLRQVHQQDRLEAVRKRHSQSKSKRKLLEVKKVQVDGISFLSTDLSNTPPHITCSKAWCVGDIGYIKGTTFEPLFNACDVQIIGNYFIPAISSTGEIDIKTIRMDGSCEECSDGAMERMKKFMQRILPSQPTTRIQCFDPRSEGTVWKWFELHFERIQKYCAEQTSQCKENIVLVTGITLE